MTHTNLAVNSIGSGYVFTFAAAGDSCLVAANVRIGSTGNHTINGTVGSNILDVEGRVSASTTAPIALFGSGNNVTIGVSGSVIGTQTADYGESAVYFGDSSSTFTNLGKVSSLGGVGTYFHQDSTFRNSGTVNAATPVYEVGDGSEVINLGTLKANAASDAAADATLNNAIFMSGAGNVITNEKHGSLSAISTEGSGITLSSGSDGSTVTNKGTINSQNWYGVDFGNMAATEAASLSNSGTITGGTGSFRGGGGGDMITNAGTMRGDVQLNDGDDYFDGHKGTVVGNIDGGIGNDVILGSKGNQRITGGAGNDILDGGAGNDLLRGGNDIDRFVFATSYGKDEIADFVNGTDLIDLSGWKEIKNFASLKSHAEKHGHDLWIVTTHDTLVIDNAKLAQLHETSFIF